VVHEHRRTDPLAADPKESAFLCCARYPLGNEVQVVLEIQHRFHSSGEKPPWLSSVRHTRNPAVATLADTPPV
jgi:hypothetical protein